MSRRSLSFFQIVPSSGWIASAIFLAFAQGVVTGALETASNQLTGPLQAIISCSLSDPCPMQRPDIKRGCLGPTHSYWPLDLLELVASCNIVLHHSYRLFVVGHHVYEASSFTV